MLKCPSDAFNKPILKLLKNQIPYLGKKWRASNISIVSKIYLSIPHRLSEEYLCGEGDTDPVAAQQIDTDLRNLVAFYNSHLPLSKAAENPETISPFSETYESFCELSLQDIDASIIEENDAFDDDEKWIDSLVVDEMELNGEWMVEQRYEVSELDKVFSNPSFNMELLEEDSLMNSFETL